jgi:holliday junction DNA helicase RuvB
VGVDIRPRTLTEYVGQEHLKPALLKALEGAKQRHEPLDHTLIFGPAGLGKTTLVGVIAYELGYTLMSIVGSAIEKTSDLVGVLIKVKPQTVLFIDELHAIPRAIEETLYVAMEDGVLDTVIGSGMNTRGLRMRLPPFTLAGATTKLAQLSVPLRDRFGNKYALRHYTDAELSTIVQRTATVYGCDIESEACNEIARRSRGVARVANTLVSRVRDYSRYIDRAAVNACMADLGIDELGLTDLDRSLLKLILTMFNAGPVGLNSLAAASGEDEGMIKEVVEPFLLRMDLISRTPRGRILTQRGLEVCQNGCGMV